MVDKPLDVLTIDYIYVCIALQNAHAVLLSACADCDIQMCQVMPLGGFLLPDGVSYAQGRNDKHLMDSERVL
jgi:hypothetical protein